jgi:hypothetical protein
MRTKMGADGGEISYEIGKEKKYNNSNNYKPGHVDEKVK